MRLNRTTYVIAASTLALIALLVFQVKWLSDSHNLIQEQFDEKVHLALCYAAGSMMVESPSTCAASEDTCVPLHLSKHLVWIVCLKLLLIFMQLTWIINGK